MFRTSLFLLCILTLCSFRQGFESKQDAIDFLNNSNIWMGGLPEFHLDNEKGMLNIVLKSDEGSVTASLPLSRLQAELITGNTVTVELNCRNGEFCAYANTQNATAETDGLTLVMSSTFDDGTYHDKYLEQGAKIADAFDYLISFYTR